MEVRRVEPPDDEELLEQWTSDGVEALLPDDHPWQIVVGVAEFVDVSDPVHQALLLVPGVTDVAREDTEVWLAWGTPKGADLVRAAAEAIEPLLPEINRQQPHPGRREQPPSRSLGPIVASLVLAVLGAVLLVSGLASGDRGTAVLGGATLLFFGGGAAVLLRR